MQEYLYRNRFLIALSLLNFILVYAASFNKAYGYFIDELYYIACAHKPAFGYVDHPPFAPLVLTVFQWFFGDSVLAIRFIPAFVASASVFLTGRLTAEIGGGSRAQMIAALAILCTPVAAAFAGFYSMNVFEPFLTIVMLLLCIRLIKTGETKLLLLLGIVIGIGMLNKHTFGVGVFMLILAVVIAGKGRLLWNRNTIWGALLAFLIFLPNIIWQVLNGYPSLEFYHNISVNKNVYTPPLQFIIGQLINMSPFTALVWVPGVLFFFLRSELKPYRFLGVFFLLVFGFMMVSGTSRADRTLFAYPAVFAGGAVGLDVFFRINRVKILPYILSFLLLGGLILSLPLLLPYFSYQTVAEHVHRLGINTEIEVGKRPPLPQLLADRIGWEEKSALLFAAYSKLTTEEKKHTIIATDNYGKAGALELFGKQYGIGQVICSHNNYYLWGVGKVTGDIVLILDDIPSVEGYKRGFDSVTVDSVMYTNPYVSAHENNLVVITCRKPKQPLPELFESGRVYQ